MLPRRPLITAFVALAAFGMASQNALATTPGMSSDTPPTYLGLNSSGGEVMRLTATGSVGIGTTGPQSSLDVRNAVSGETDLISVTNAGYTNGLKNIAWKDQSLANVGAIGVVWDGVSQTEMQFHSLFNSAYKTSTSVAMTIKGNGNVGIGTTGPGYKLDVNGDVSVSNIANAYYLGGNKIMFLPASDTTSLAVGPGALVSQTTTWLNNTAVGDDALYQNTTGNTNTAIGTYALYQNTTFSFNTAIGAGALYASTGGFNTAIGEQALGSNTTGGANTAIGLYALGRNTTGGFNVGIGFQVGSNTLQTGNYNILIGTSGAVDTPAAGTSNWLNIGNTIYADMAAGKVGVGSSTINATLDVNGYAKLKINSAAPVACGATYEGSIAYTGTTTHYLCFCDGTSWKQAHSPATACTW
jgi:hypothetical protein